MLESILEKLLSKYFGDFIEGLDKNNLKIGVWSGNIELKNVKLKTDIITKLELPLFISYSFIGKLDVKLPWKSLGSKPVEVKLEDVYIIVSPLNSNEWRNFDFNSVTKRLAKLEKFVKECLQKINVIDKTPNQEQNEDQGMKANMTTKVLDNLQVKHIIFLGVEFLNFSFRFL